MTGNRIRPVLIGVAGASGAGKSYFTQALREKLRAEETGILSQDDYYHDQSHIPFSDRELVNYDHPQAVDFDLLIEHLKRLKAGEPIEHPRYDFSRHTRRRETGVLKPKRAVIVDGILIFSVAACRELFDLRIFIDTPLDLCFIRRLQRDLIERGRSVESIVNQYLCTVRPMFLQFVETSRVFADRIFCGEGDMSAAVDETVRLVDKIIAEKKP
ncbi:MAG: uridine kinase [candidate division KSB1 bacterium]|nr:uridine kinase [candidate division KSB1 bacterium]MDZ7347129.1 uridine kinase [candidate division KSB1 bacterium]